MTRLDEESLGMTDDQYFLTGIICIVLALIGLRLRGHVVGKILLIVGGSVIFLTSILKFFMPA